MALPLPLPREESSRVALAIYKPITGSDIHDALRHITTQLIPAFHKAGTTKAAALNSVNGSWVAIFSVWKTSVSEKEESRIADELGNNWASSVVRVVEWRWFHLSCEEHRDVSFAELRFGDIVSLRRIGSSRRKQEVLAYSCLAILKAYFKEMKGIRSYTFYSSVDGKRIIGLGIWDNIQSASAVLKEANGSPAEPYWYSLGAKKLKYEVCQVVFVSTAPQLEKVMHINSTWERG